jgi:acyl carrier protein
LSPLEASLMEFLRSIAPPGCDLDLQAGQLELESLAILQVAVYLETHYGIRLAEHNVEPDDLRSVAGILALIQRCA